MLDWVQESTDYWVSGVYAIRRLHTDGAPKKFRFVIVSAPEDFRRLDHSHNCLSDAQRECASHANLKEVAAEAPPLSVKQQATIASIIAGGNGNDREGRTPYPSKGPVPQGLNRGTFPGQARSNDEVLHDYQKAVSEAPMRRIWFGEPEDIFRWRLQFDCGCIEERLGRTDDPHSLLTVSVKDWLTGRRLMPGEYLCAGRHEKLSIPLRTFASWNKYTRRFAEEEPEEAPDSWEQDEWDAIRCKESGWVHDWEATLSCGHEVAVRSQPLDWTPDRVRERLSDERLAKIRADFEAIGLDDYHQRLLEAGWPDLSAYRDCSSCPRVRKIVVYEPLGWLVPPPPKPRKPRKEKSPKERLEIRLKEAELEARRLRAELEKLEN
jgi:hypothetical protein